MTLEAFDDAIAARGADQLIAQHRAEIANSNRDPRPEPPPIEGEEPLPPGYSFAQALVLPLASSYFIKNMARPGEISVFFGESGAKKSFAVTDGALHVAADLPLWLGNRVRGPAGVLFVIGEGAAGFPKRLRAWAMEHGATDLPAYVHPAPVDLFGGPEQLQRVIEQAEDSIACAISLVVVDPLGVMFGAGDESKNGDAARVFSNLRIAIGNTRAALVVHHVGHGDKGRERGAMTIRTNADARFLVEYQESTNIVTIGHLKEKEGERGDPTFLTSRVVVLGTDEDGDSITSLVLEATAERPTETAEWKGAIKHSDQLALRALGPLWLKLGRRAVLGSAWRQELHRLDLLPQKTQPDDSDSNRKAFQRLAKVLRDAELITQEGSGKATSYSPATPGIGAEGIAT